MARMNSGAAVQDFSALANIDYSRTPEMLRLGRERSYQAEKIRGDRVRSQAELPALKEINANNLLRKGSEAAISGILQSNPELLGTLESGTDSEQVNKAYKKFVGGNTNLADNTILSQFLTQADKGMKEAKALQFEQQQTQMASATRFMNAQASQLKAKKALEAGSDLVTKSQLEEFEGQGFMPTFTVAGTNADGKQLFKVSELTRGQVLTPEQVIEGREAGLDYKGQVTEDGGMFVTGFNSVGMPNPLDNMDPASLEMYKQIGKDMAPWLSAKTGGAIKAQANLDSYNEVITMLESDEISTGEKSDKVISLLNVGNIADDLRAIFTPKDQNAIELVRGVVFQGLRETLGAQFTEREGRQLVQASYNPALSREANIGRLRRLATVLQATINYKTDLSERMRKGELLDDFKAGAIIDAQDVYIGLRDSMYQDFALEDKLLGKVNPNGYPTDASVSTTTSDNITIEYK